MPTAEKEPHYKLGPSAAGGAVIRRGTFQPDNKRQQRQLRRDARQARRLASITPVPELRPAGDYKKLSPEETQKLGYDIAAGKAIDPLAKHAAKVGGGPFATAAELAVGPNLHEAAMGEHYSRVGLALDVGALIPVLRPFKALTAADRAAKLLKGGAGAKVALEGARAALHESGPIDRAVGKAVGGAVRGIGKGAKRIHPRVFRHGDFEQIIPAANSKPGRLLERAFDAARPITSKTGLVKTEGEKAGQEFKRSARNLQKIRTNEAEALKAVSKQLKAPHEYALRILAEQAGHPGVSILDRFEHHLELAKTTPKVESLYHTIHADLIDKASKYLALDAEGNPIGLRADAPAKLKRAWALVQRVGHQREDIYGQLGRLSDETIAARVHAPARVLKGARYKEFEGQVKAALESSVPRQRFFSEIDQHVEDPVRAKALKTIFDQMARSEAQRTGNALEVTPFYDRIAVSPEMLGKDALDQAAWHTGDEDLSHLTKDLGGPINNADLERIAAEHAASGDEAVAPVLRKPPSELAAEGVEIPTMAHDAEFWTEGIRIKSQGRTVAKLEPDMTWTVWGDESSKATKVGLKSASSVLKELGGGDEELHQALSDAERIMREHHRRAGLPVDEVFPQRGGALKGVGPYGVKGQVSFTPEGGQAIIHLTEHADPTTFVHELAHVVRRELQPGEEKRIAKFFGAKRVNGEYVWDRASEEKFARGVEAFVRRGDGPSPIKQAFKSLAPAFRDIYEQADLPDLPQHVAQTLEKLFAADRLKGGRIVGADDLMVGSNYAPYVRGVPVTRSQPVKSFGAYVRSFGRLYGSGRGSAVGLNPKDTSLEKEFRGSLLLNGFFKPDVAGPVADGQFLAARLSAAHTVRKVFVAAGSEVPRDISDIAVKVDPKKDAGDNLKAVWDRLDSIDNGGAVLSAKDLEQIDLHIVEKAREDVFPARIGEEDVRDVAAKIIREEIPPVDNIVWVNRDFIEESGVLRVEGAQRAAGGGWFKSMQRLSRTERGKGPAGIPADLFNDLQKAMILYLNPAYVPVNLAGNLTMNFFHQGVFMAPNLWRSVLLHRDLEYEDRRLVDSLMGHGLTGSLSLKTTPGQLIHNTLGHWINMAVDLYPRRAAFLHEASRLGYKDPEALKALFSSARNGEQEAVDTLDHIARKANDAIVDYERLSPLEREVISRWIFFYPWLKGATRYSVRFGMEHPYQAAALALMAEHANEVTNEDIGPRPYYAQFAVPLDTKALGVPGLDLSDIIGEHKLDENGNPVTFNVRQLFTQTTPLELGEAGVGFALGDKNAPDLVSNLTPLPYAAGVSIFGYDPFLHKEVPSSIGTFYDQVKGNLPLVDKIGSINMSAEERKQRNAKALYPRTKVEDIQHALLGGLAFTPINTKIANERAAGGPKGKSPAQHASDWEHRFQKDLGAPAPADVRVARESKAIYQQSEKDLKKKLKVTKLDERQRAGLKVQALASSNPTIAGQFKTAIDKAPDDETLKEIESMLEEQLHWDVVDEYSSQMRDVEKARGRK